MTGTYAASFLVPMMVGFLAVAFAVVMGLLFLYVESEA
ncbi:MAG: photosystem I reaction center subunit VIII [Symploca sp. SIO1A3]|nr:photosystem I reaction center subunit VIII [Symploca sp. SIO2C1]NER45134.1 photosystem I reaction center subunit VIII [Symploca sp. SIO1A3]